MDYRDYTLNPAASLRGRPRRGVPVAGGEAFLFFQLFHLLDLLQGFCGSRGAANSGCSRPFKADLEATKERWPKSQRAATIGDPTVWSMHWPRRLPVV